MSTIRNFHTWKEYFHICYQVANFLLVPMRNVLYIGLHIHINQFSLEGLAHKNIQLNNALESHHITIHIIRRNITSTTRSRKIYHNQRFN